MNDGASEYLYHEACPKCGSKDNVGVYNDGHKWCFGCGYYVPPPIVLKNNFVGHTFDTVKIPNFDNVIGSDYTYTLPQKAHDWLKKYGIMDSEIKFHKWLWNEKRQLLTFPVFKDGKVILMNERYFGTDPKHPKYLTRGQVASTCYIIVARANANRVVFVEDAVSAVKVNRYVSVVPLFGSTISVERLKTACEPFKSGAIWLDFDKVGQSIKIASLAKQKENEIACKLSTIVSELDPKELSNEAIKNKLKDAGLY